MDKELVKIQNRIGQLEGIFSSLFFAYNERLSDFINLIKSDNEVYLFSGIIRDFFLQGDVVDDLLVEIRDVDLVVRNNVDLTRYNYPFRKNSFGGYKLKIDNIDVDLWLIKDTWGLKNRKSPQLFLQEMETLGLLESTFFNASSVLFDLNNFNFIVDEPFLKFLRGRTLDIVLEDNPYPELCVANSIHYVVTKNLKLSKKLREYVRKYNTENRNDWSDLLRVQERHFGRILYDQKFLENWFTKRKLKGKIS